MLLLALFVPVVGALIAWLANWPTWTRVIATVWSIIVIFAAIGLATDTFGPHGQSTTGERVPAATVATSP